MEILLALPGVYSSMAWTTFWIWFASWFSQVFVFVGGTLGAMTLAYKFIKGKAQ